MNNRNEESHSRDLRLEEMRAEMDRIIRIAEKAKRGEATESELSELKAIDDKIDSIPRDVVTG